VPLDVDWDACTARFDPQRVTALFRELNFRSLLPRIATLTGAGEAAPAVEEQLSIFGADEPATHPVLPAAKPDVASPTASRLVASDDDYRALLAELNAAALIAFDTETTGRR